MPNMLANTSPADRGPMAYLVAASTCSRFGWSPRLAQIRCCPGSRFLFPLPGAPFPQISASLTSDAERWALPVEDAPLGGTRGTSYQCGGRAALPRSPATPPDAASVGSKI